MFGPSVPMYTVPGGVSHICASCGALQYSGRREAHASWCPRLPPEAITSRPSLSGYQSAARLGKEKPE